MLTFAKLFFSGLNLKNLTLYALLGTIILSLVMYLLWQNEKTSHTLTASKYEAFVEKLELKKIENDKLEKIREKKYQDLEKEYNLVKVDRDKIRKGLKDEINRNGSLLNSIRMLENNTSDKRWSENEIPTSLLAEVGRDSNATIVRLVEAGRSCAKDYNGLYDAWMEHCNTFGCVD